MQGHRNGGRPIRLPDPHSLEYRAQRIVLLELVVDPPDAGDRLADLVGRLGLPSGSVEPAATALALTGLVERHGDVVRASLPARYFEYLWPVLLGPTRASPSSSYCSTTNPVCCRRRRSSGR